MWKNSKSLLQTCENCTNFLLIWVHCLLQPEISTNVYRLTGINWAEQKFFKKMGTNIYSAMRSNNKALCTVYMCIFLVGESIIGLLIKEQLYIDKLSRVQHWKRKICAEYSSQDIHAEIVQKKTPPLRNFTWHSQHALIGWTCNMRALLFLEIFTITFQGLFFGHIPLFTCKRSRTLP